MKSKRNVYLKMKPLAEARKILSDAFPRFGTLEAETVPAPDAAGRVLAEPIFASVSAPNFHAAAMDGVAVKAEITFGISETRPGELIIGKDAFYVNTGHVLPDGTNAVIMVEHLNVLDEDRVEIEAPAFPWQNVRRMGEDIVATELLFSRNHRVTPYCVGALIEGGVFSVPVRRKPRVMVIPTGSEIVDWRKTPIENVTPGQVLDSNSYVLGKLTEACGGEFVRHEVVRDDLGLITQAVEEAVKGNFDIVLTVGGSSAGSEDYTREMMADLGEVLVHGVTIMPGKPVLIGKIGNKPVLGMPGYPVSMIVAFEQFVRPLICRMLGQPEPEPVKIPVETTRKLPSRLGVEEFLRVRLGKVGDRIVATSLPRGAGCITSITEADGIIRIPAHSEGIREHETVTAELLRPLNTIRNTLVAVGSHDNTLDVLADQLRADHGGLTLSSSHVGSMGGLMAIKRGVCHLAGSHLLDTEDGSYNLSWVKRFLPETAVRIVNLVFREQGLIVARGNPKGIQGIEDLAREDVRFMNRQSGSGTRILLDYRLGQIGMAPASVNGYATEEFTHMAVAVAVLSGSVDVGLGIYAAAKALNLDFIPVVTEQYDLIIPEEYFGSENMRILLDTINTGAFKSRVEALGGYSTEKTGEIIL
ncbi:molybdopterin biosynthesis protein [Desulfonema ishimotonii]|uniref:Molybdopterin molybdenumtransferase n=1 Tax=Desulfonema ishimotonii TaxID=45657 RepID=A0A401FZF3_9BACT|nr:molybdopterin biosynthesis protein [Desulfonema ishimotonii]GBC62372.1 molybdopterin biosynthesis protein [Desulfonema ishimotonii]